MNPINVKTVEPFQPIFLRQLTLPTGKDYCWSEFFYNHFFLNYEKIDESWKICLLFFNNLRKENARRETP